MLPIGSPGLEFPGAQTRPAPSSAHNVPHPHSCWAPALGQAWGARQHIAHIASSSSFINSIPWSGTEPGSPGPLPSPSESCYSGNLKTLAQKRVSKRGLGRGECLNRCWSRKQGPEAKRKASHAMLNCLDCPLKGMGECGGNFKHNFKQRHDTIAFAFRTRSVGAMQRVGRRQGVEAG